MIRTGLFLITILLLLSSCSPDPQQSAENPFDGPNPWPDIRKERIQTLLPQAMQRADIDTWVILCRSNNNDPLARHIGCENAIAPAVFIFELEEETVRSTVFTPPGEATALREIALHDSISVVDRSPGAMVEAANYLNNTHRGRLALNFSETNEIADGLSYSQYQRFTDLLIQPVINQIVSSENLVFEWLSVKTPAEVDILRKAAELTAEWEVEAYQQVIPNETTDKDIADFLKAKMREYGVTDAWSPDQNPAVNSGPDRGHSHPTEKIIRPGDVIQIDFGIKVYDMWVTDIQRFAYILHPDETEPPAEIQRYWNVARDANRMVLEVMQPGITGLEVDRVQRNWLAENGSMNVMWNTGHPVGYVAHDVGPSLGGAQEGREPSSTAFEPLRVGNVFAYDGFYMWEIEGGTKTISVEEMAVVTENGANYLTEPQEELILISSD
ncbi:M24 family metallopeptidase [Rhodohalobacter sp.]|uniref:M24 family metallopeptidase n=1 Tax=Rhodohalobacter sp. TaxID=1974210 RepID=UPI002ACDBD4F|nr:M24 family metallopeptidase [Rhodohalobacter sp.]MDZ7755086.1 M24 family metallopeptidase [Rhodohalobacter sp.]